MDLTGQWADTLLAAERIHLAKLGIWALASIAAGSLVFTLLRLRGLTSPLLRHFAIQMVAWGAVCGAISLWAGRGVTLRDLAGAVALERFVWLNIGLDIGYAGVGVTLALAGWSLGRRLGLVGAGTAIAIQGTALALLDLQLAAAILR